MKQPSTLARKGPVRAVGFLRIRLFLYLGVLSFTLETSSNNLLLRVSKSRVAGFRSDLSFRNKGYRIGVDCITKERSRESGSRCAKAPRDARIPLSAISRQPPIAKLMENC